MIVGFTGLKGSGKDTAAQALIEIGWEQAAFADELRAMLYALDPLVGMVGNANHIYRWSELYDTWGYDRLKTLPEARRLMQAFGDEVMRQRFDQDVWVDLLMRKVNQLEIEDRDVVVTDVRYDNEAASICKREGVVIEIIRPGTARDDHGSEAGVSREYISQTLHNSGSIENLQKLVKEVLVHV